MGGGASAPLPLKRVETQRIGARGKITVEPRAQENTVDAVRLGFLDTTHRPVMMEINIVRAKDGTLYCIHDNYSYDLTGQRKPVQDMTPEELAQLTYLQTIGNLTYDKPRPVPTLRQMIQEVIFDEKQDEKQPPRRLWISVKDPCWTPCCCLPCSCCCSCSSMGIRCPSVLSLRDTLLQVWKEADKPKWTLQDCILATSTNPFVNEELLKCFEQEPLLRGCASKDYANISWYNVCYRQELQTQSVVQRFPGMRVVSMDAHHATQAIVNGFHSKKVQVILWNVDSLETWKDRVDFVLVDM